MNTLIDTSVFCGYWPFRCLSQRTPEALKSFLEGEGVSLAWVAALEAILYPDPMQANEPLFAAIAGDAFFLPVAIIDVSLATWRRDALTCLETWGCGAFKLVPNYHHYDLAYPRVADLVDLAGEAQVPICIQLRMMDERGHHPLMKVPPVPPEEVVALARRHPEAHFLACGAYRDNLPVLSGAPNVWAEISLVESGNALASAVEAMGPERVVFGSHSPFLYFEAIAAKLDADPIDADPEVVDAVRGHNASVLLGAG